MQTAGILKYEMIGILGYNSALQGYAGQGTWANEMNFDTYDEPGAVLIAQPVDLQPSMYHSATTAPHYQIEKHIKL